MTNKKMILFFLLLAGIFSDSALACLHATQHKIFPVGTFENQIYSIDYKLERTENYKLKQRFNLNVPEPKNQGMKPVWLIYGSLVIYDQQQSKIKSIAIDTTYILAREYGDSLKSSYKRSLAFVKKNYPELDYFSPDYFSFCDYQTACEKVSVSYDPSDSTNYIQYKNKKYPVPVFNDSTFKNPQINPYLQEQIDFMRINSVRVYKNKSMELALVHMATGDYFDIYTTDKNLAGTTNEDGMEYKLSKEYKPDFDFKTIENGTYFEPVFHHGYGVDLFIVK